MREKDKVDRKIAVRESVKRYNAKFDQIAFRVPKGEKETWKQIAASRGMSLQQYILSLVYADNPNLFPVESEKIK